MWRVGTDNPYELATPDERVAALGAQEWSVLSVEELHACGLNRNAIATRRRREQFHLVFRGVYKLGDPSVSMHQLFLAAVKACGRGAALSHFSDLALWQILAWDPERPPDVVVPADGCRGITGITVHRTRRPFRIVRFDNIPATLPGRALADLSSMMPFKTHRRATREAMARKRVTTMELMQEPKLRRYLADEYVPTRSELEDVVLDLLDAGGFARPDVNKPLGIDIPDFRWPEQQLIIEADSRTWHDNPIARADDAARQARLEAQGERVIRVTWSQAIAHAKQTLARIHRAGAPRTVN